MVGGPNPIVDGDLADSIKRSASDRLGDLVPQGAGLLHGFSRHGASRPLSRNVLSMYNPIAFWSVHTSLESSHFFSVFPIQRQMHEAAKLFFEMLPRQQSTPFVSKT